MKNLFEDFIDMPIIRGNILLQLYKKKYAYVSNDNRTFKHFYNLIIT